MSIQNLKFGLPAFICFWVIFTVKQTNTAKSQIFFLFKRPEKVEKIAKPHFRKFDPEAISIRWLEKIKSIYNDDIIDGYFFNKAALMLIVY